MADGNPPRWRLPPGQRLAFEEFDDGVLMFDALVGGTHLLNLTAAEALAALVDRPGLTAPELRDAVVGRLALEPGELPVPAIETMLERLAELDIVTADVP